GRTDGRCARNPRHRRTAPSAGCGLPRGCRLRAAAGGQSRGRARAADARERARCRRSDHSGVPPGARAARDRGAAELMAKRVVVVGGGFAGLHLVRKLEGLLRPGEVELTLIDRNNYHLFTPLLYQVATGELPPHAVAYPLRLPIAHARQRFVQTEVEGV